MIFRVTDRQYPVRGFRDETTVRCPRCKENCSHIRDVESFSDYDDRRESVAIRFEGECGHNWQLLLQQHKGVTVPTFRMIE